jgi:fatty acid desaturase
MYAAHALSWSSQNYVNHAFSPRDIINGAHNHRMNPLIQLLHLNFNIHLVHHQKPRLPWIHLRAFMEHSPERISFYRNYLRLWKGPVLTHEPSPIPIHENVG